MNAFEVVAAGPMTLVQDGGRPGLAHLGVGASGAFDRGAARLANRLVGNRSGAAVLEVLVGGLEIRFDSDAWVAVTGAWGPITAMGAVEPHTPTLVPAGRTLRIGTAEHGIRWYLAVRGGIAANPVLDSRSRDTLAALGPAPLAEGDRVLVGGDIEGPVPGIDLVPVDPPADGPVRISVRPGPRADWFSSDAWSLMLESAWTTSPRSDRTGIRLEGPTLERARTGELPSEGMIPGAIQVSPDGVPTILGVDAPVTGGYPVLAVVTDGSLDALAQLRPGQPVRFTLATGRS
ncbi:biotin-dependent carboxyltransferase family protein [Naasia lichenicola]|uniref:Biotin-dependent carboxyltransferase family protein n=1 Tax=Naasia lichenicola TaxID=2565933 RepID=A0A4S4FHJ4_9MICO|nr:biotin-dependent carboxyltransferase family protein [Naasia lichenicola]THG29793.1 biotin-dependent carboxyltransferase family protein [Naasia lichenicola]